MSDEIFSDTLNTEKNEGDFEIDLTQGLYLHIKFAGIAVIKDHNNGKKERVEVEDHIKLSQSGLNIKLTPFQAACLFKAIQEKENSKIIEDRFKVEQKELSKVGF